MELGKNEASIFKSAVYNEYKNNDKPVLSSCAVLTPFGINIWISLSYTPDIWMLRFCVFYVEIKHTEANVYI